MLLKDGPGSAADVTVMTHDSTRKPEGGRETESRWDSISLLSSLEAVRSELQGAVVPHDTTKRARSEAKQRERRTPTTSCLFRWPLLTDKEDGLHNSLHHPHHSSTTERKRKIIIMTIIYGLVSVGKNVLAEYTQTSGKRGDSVLLYALAGLRSGCLP